MPQMTFTQFRNELAQVLGTRQHAGAKSSTKAMMTSSVEVEPDKQDQTKSKGKQKAKISAQSSQIKDLCTKLDQAVAENSQIKEFLSLNGSSAGIHNCLASHPVRPKQE